MPTRRDLDAELDERLQRFAAGGMSRAGMLAQLNLAGYPTELLRQRFPEFPDVAFGLAKPATPAGIGSQGSAPVPAVTPAPNPIEGRDATPVEGTPGKPVEPSGSRLARGSRGAVAGRLQGLETGARRSRRAPAPAGAQQDSGASWD
jgi:hypothetical protein